MATNPDLVRADRDADQLIDAYRVAQARLLEQIEAAILSGNLHRAEMRRAQLAQALAVIDELGWQTDPVARRLIEDAVEQGAERARRQVIGMRIDAPEIPGAFAGVQREAVEALQDQILGRLDTARRTIGRQVADVYARQQRQAAMQALLGASGSPRTAAQDLQQRLLRDRRVQELVKQGGVGFIDKAGKRWQLADYADMATRTVVREAAVEGAKIRMASHGVRLARVSSHPDPCKICAPWQGRLVSLDGQAADFQGESATDLGSLPNGGPPMHPRCKHTLSPVASRIESIRREMQAAGRL